MSARPRSLHRPRARSAPRRYAGAWLLPWFSLGACGAGGRPADAAAQLDAAPAAGDDAGVDGAEPGLDASADAAVPETRLLDHTAWHGFDAVADPLKSHQPADASCGLGGYFADTVYHTLDVETAYCNYLLIAHPAQADVAEGDRLRLRFYHFDLVAPEPAQAHVALLLDDALGWETTIPIPSRANAYDVTFAAPRALAVGEPIRFHLHNHGQNSWVLTSLTRLR